MQTVYFDVSEVLLRGLNTGIQRVVRQIARASTVVAADHGFTMVPIVALGRSFHRLSASGQAKLDATAPTEAPARLTDDSPATRAIKRGLALFPPIYEALSRIHTARQIRRTLVDESAGPAIAFGADDVVLLLDSFWGGCSAVDAARDAAQTRCAVVPLIYDMIPVTHPQFCESRLPRAFTREVERLIPVATGVLTISRYSAAEITLFLSALGRPLPVEYFYLGAALGDGTGGTATAWLDPILAAGGGPIYVTVGTVEPRKGHPVILDAFDRLWAAGHDARLMIIGKIGWNMETFLARCAGHAELGRRLFLVHDASDAMLNGAFDVARATILASAVEGFGLPLVEALHRKVPVIAADIPAFREIGTDNVEFFALDDPADLARVIVARDEADPNGGTARRRMASFAWLDWAGSARQMLEALRCVLASASA